MESATQDQRRLPTDRAARIIDAMRVAVAERGAAGATFDHVAREAGVSRGLLHYYFGTKERLLVEVVRRDCDVRMEALDARLGEARSADDFIAGLVVTLREIVDDDPGFVTVLFELFTLSRRNGELAAEFAELLRRVREQVSSLLRAKEADGVLHLNAEPEAVTDVVFALGDGMAMRMLGEPDRDFGPTIVAGIAAVRALVEDPA